MKVYRKIIESINKVLEYIGIGLLGLMVLIIFFHVIMRYVFNDTPSWSEEVARLCMVFFSYVGLIMGVKEKLHISIELFVSKLPKKAIFVVEIIDNLLIMVLGSLMVRYGIELISKVSKNTFPATGLSASVLYIMIPISGAMMIFILLEQTIEKIMNQRRGETDGV